MAQIRSGAIDVDNTPDMPAFELLPPGRYMAHVVSNESRAVKNSELGEMAVLTWEILEEGDFERQKVWDQIVLVKGNGDVNLFGNSRIAGVAKAVGYTGQLEDMDVLMNIPCFIHLKVKAGTPNPAGGMFPDKNEVKAVEPYVPGAPADKPATTQGQTTQQRAAAPAAGAAQQRNGLPPVASPGKGPRAWNKPGAGAGAGGAATKAPF